MNLDRIVNEIVKEFTHKRTTKKNKSLNEGLDKLKWNKLSYDDRFDILSGYIKDVKSIEDLADNDWESLPNSVVANLKRNVKESTSSYDKRIASQLGDLRTARRGATATGGGYGPFTKERDNVWVDVKRTKIYNNDGIQKFLGGFNDFKVKNESTNESYTGNIGDRLVHKHYPSIEIELLNPTNKGWKVKATQKGKTRITYFDKQDLVGDKALFEVKSNLTEFITLGINGVRRYANKHNINIRAKKQGATIYAILWNDTHDFGVFDTSITTKEELDKKILPKLKSSNNEAKVNEALDNKKLLSIYNGLKKGDEITIKYNSSISSNNEKKLVVTKGNSLVGSQKVERITLVDTKNKSGVKYYLYQRNGKVTFAIGDMAASIISLKNSTSSKTPNSTKTFSQNTFSQNPADIYKSMMKSMDTFSKPKGFGGFGGGKFGGGGAGGNW